MYNGVDVPHKRQYVRYGIAGIVGLILIGGWLWYARPFMSDSRLSVFPTSITTPESPISFEIVTTHKDQEKGLSGRKNIKPDYAMLFVFDKNDTYGIWMKGMLVPIDILWLSDNGTIITLEHNVEPSSYPHVFYPDTPARYVVEMRAGQAAARGWSVGTKVHLPLPYGK
ncbi:MAG: hypothetical protein AB203_03095 [Parcubacteria bacterium C7867-008]|nr:MAG: hypothetical protein AB203_03095 [Parcubacteria bacterium C7867-008]